MTKTERPNMENSSRASASDMIFFVTTKPQSKLMEKQGSKNAPSGNVKLRGSLWRIFLRFEGLDCLSGEGVRVRL